MAKALTAAELADLDFAEFDKRFPQFQKGNANPERLRALSLVMERLVFEVALGQRDMPKNFNPDQVKKAIETAAEKVYGIEARHLLDARSDTEKALDWLHRVLESPEKWFEASDEEITAVEHTMNEIDSLVDAHIKDRVREAESERNQRRRQGLASGLSLGKEERARLDRLRTLLKRVKKLRARARQATTKAELKNVYWSEALEAARLGRFMAYVLRSGMSKDSDPASRRVLSFGPHHAKIFFDIWEAENGVEVGPPRKEKWNNPDIWQEIGLHKGVIDYIGCVVVCPPAHGKTEIAEGFCIDRIDRNPATQGTYLHNRDDMAQDNLAYVASAFDPGTAIGRRNLSLYPNVELLVKNATEMRVRRENRKKTPTLVGAGCMSDHQGVDNDFQVYDDVVPQSDVDEETTRDRRVKRINGTWRQRLRGEDHFTLVTCTLWHHHDYNSQLIELARQGKVLFRVSRQAVGGPHTKPKFASLWDRIPSSLLEAKYREINDPSLWSATFMADPRPQESRIVRSLRLYDPESSEHETFMRAGPQFYLSLDPSYSNRQGADRSGLVYAALGLVVTEHEEDGIPVRSTQMRLRIIDAMEFRATQSEGADTVKLFAMEHDVHEVVCEAQSGGAASAEWLEREVGVPVVAYKPGNLSKEIRLRRAAKALENHSRASVTGAVVEFPGIVEDGKLRPDSRIRPLMNQILEFGITPHDHMLDACTQLVNHLRGDLLPGSGEFSEAVRKAVEKDTDPRIKRWLEKIRRPDMDNRVDTEWTLLG